MTLCNKVAIANRSREDSCEKQAMHKKHNDAQKERERGTKKNCDWLFLCVNVLAAGAVQSAMECHLLTHTHWLLMTYSDIIHIFTTSVNRMNVTFAIGEHRGTER